jgi:hypothetical protein
MDKPNQNDQDPSGTSNSQEGEDDFAARNRRAKELIETRKEIQSEDPRSAEEVTFMSSILVQATLPHSDPGDVEAWGRSNGKADLYIQPGVEKNENGEYQKIGLPYGSYPRLLLVWMTSEVARTGRRRLNLGDSLSAFMRDLGLQVTGGEHGTIGRFQEQMRRLFASKIGMVWREPNHEKRRAALVADELDLWWDPADPDQATLWESSVRLSQPFFEALRDRPVPADRRILRRIKQSSLAIDLYLWLTHRVTRLDEPLTLSWKQLHDQMGANYSRASNFGVKAREHLKEISVIWEELQYETPRGRLRVYPSPPSVPENVDE